MELPNALKRVLVIACAVAAAGAVPGAAQARDTLPAARALGLFDEGLGAKARLRGDTHALPAAVARCASCHGRGVRAPERLPRARDIAPRLDAVTLLQPASRRRGPPSRYDEASFCGLLRTGVDPAGVMVARTMPVYAIDADACGALWRLLAATPR